MPLRNLLYKVTQGVVKTRLIPDYVKNRMIFAAGSFRAESHVPLTEWGWMGFIIRIPAFVADATEAGRPEQR